jgi:hypothetical protein
MTGMRVTALWARNNGWPSIFQVLCHNCNFLKRLEAAPIGISRHAQRHREIRREVLTHYANGPIKCAMCDITDVRVLTIDHIGGGGCAHRKSLGTVSGISIYKWLLASGFPEGFRVLCWNHNTGAHCLS